MISTPMLDVITTRRKNYGSMVSTRWTALVVAFFSSSALQWIWTHHLWHRFSSERYLWFTKDPMMGILLITLSSGNETFRIFALIESCGVQSVGTDHILIRGKLNPRIVRKIKSRRIKVPKHIDIKNKGVYENLQKTIEEIKFDWT